MKRKIYIALALTAMCSTTLACDNTQASQVVTSDDESVAVVAPKNDVSQVDSVKEINSVPQEAQWLIEAYPEQKLQYKDGKIVFPDGYAVEWDDGKKKSFVEQLDNSDIEDSFAMPYQLGGEPTFQADGGRSRSDAFFKKMYGSSSAAVQKNLTTVNWFGTNIKVTKVNGVDKKLKAVAAELAKHPELRKYIEKPQSFYWRKVRGSNRQSAHSYGIAVDMGIKYSNYWLWTYPRANENTQIKYKNRFPEKIAKIFEKYGFIWGGRWYHFDTMHFEYRPEILKGAKR